MTSIQPFRRIASRFGLALITAGLLFSGGLRAQDKEKEKAKPITFQELSSKLTIDKNAASKGTALVTSYADVLDKVTPAVVTIFSEREPDPETQEMLKDPLFKKMLPAPDDRVTGSGIIISTDGYILTNNHVVEQTKKLEVHINATRQTLEAKLVVADPKSDVALIKVQAENLAKLTIGDSGQLRVGDVAFAVGNPFGLEQTVTMGIVSAMGRSHQAVGNLVEYGDFIQTDASINRGNSGGALVDAQGRLIGINTAIQSGMTGGNLGIGFSIPVNMAMDIVDRLLTGGGVVRRGLLGVQLKPLYRDLAESLGWKENYGVAVDDVVPTMPDGNPTPAVTAGFQADDIIMSYQGQKADSLDTLRLRISNTPPGQEVLFKIFRGGKEMELKAKLAELPQNLAALVQPGGGGGGGVPAPAAPKAQKFMEGVEIIELTPENRAANNIAEDIKGALVQSVAPDSVAASNGLREGQVILEVNKKQVNNVAEAMAERGKFNGTVLLLRVSSEGNRTSLTIRMKD